MMGSAIKSFVAFVFLLLSFQNAIADNIDQELVDLVDEPSRSDLFDLIIAADIIENGPLSADDTAAFDLSGPFSFPEDSVVDRHSGNPREESLFCIDVSHHQGKNVNFAAMQKQNVRCAYVKATQGTRFKDPRFAENWVALSNLPKSPKVYRGAYHFLSADANPETQASNYLRLVGNHGGFKGDDLPPVVDLEWDIGTPGGADRWLKHSPEKIIQSTISWLKIVEASTGKKPMIYTARSWWRAAIGSEDKIRAFDGYKIWIADYSRSAAALEIPKTPANADWHLWQFTDRARFVDGVDHRVDANIYKGTEADFIKDFELK